MALRAKGEDVFFYSHPVMGTGDEVGIGQAWPAAKDTHPAIPCIYRPLDAA